MVPVPATNVPPVRSPLGELVDDAEGEHETGRRAADVLASAIEMVNGATGRSTAPMPSTPWLPTSGLAPSVTFCSTGSLAPSRSTVTGTVCPGVVCGERGLQRREVRDRRAVDADDLVLRLQDSGARASRPGSSPT